MPSEFGKIIDQLVVELKKIKTANGYTTNIQDESITKLPNQWLTFPLFPCICITYIAGDTESFLHAGGKLKTKTVRLWCKFKELAVAGNSAMEQAAELEYDIEKLISLNPKLTDANGDDLVSGWFLTKDTGDDGAFAPHGIWRADLLIRYYEEY